jgi:hypothetical protein
MSSGTVNAIRSIRYSSANSKIRTSFDRMIVFIARVVPCTWNWLLSELFDWLLRGILHWLIEGLLNWLVNRLLLDWMVDGLWNRLLDRLTLMIVLPMVHNPP